MFIFLLRFIEKAKNILGAAKKIREELAKIDGIEVCSFDEVIINSGFIIFIDLQCEFRVKES